MMEMTLIITFNISIIIILIKKNKRNDRIVLLSKLVTKSTRLDSLTFYRTKSNMNMTLVNHNYDVKIMTKTSHFNLIIMTLHVMWQKWPTMEFSCSKTTINQ